MSILLQTLANLKSSQSLCEVSLDNPEDSFFCQIIDFNETLGLVRKILSDNGDFDGYSLIFLPNIRNIIWEGDLLQQLEILLEDRNPDKKAIQEKIQNININNNSFFKLIKTINSLFGHISVYEVFDRSDFYFGQVKDIDEEHMLMRLMGDKFNMDDQSMVIRLEDIGRIDFGGIYDENMLRLHQLKKRVGVK
jgi:hypothetical protein